MESIQPNPATQGLIRDLRSTIERMQEKVKTLEDRIVALEGFTDGRLLTLQQLTTEQSNATNPDNGAVLYNKTTHEIWVQIDGVMNAVDVTPV